MDPLQWPGEHSLHEAAALPDVQLDLRPGIIDFGWGHPANSLLPVEGLRRSALDALANGGAALAYGAAQGPGRLIAALCKRLARVEGHAPSPERVLITGGISQAIDLLCTLYVEPGD